MRYKQGLPVSLALAVTIGGVAVAESTDTIRIPMNEWTGQNLSARIMGELLTDAGYSVEYVTAGAVPQFTAISQGELHVQPENWTNNVGDIYQKALDSGAMKIVGDLGVVADEGWIYPPYMEERCPGLPNYTALMNCAEAFTSADTYPKGRLIDYPADWGPRSRALIEKFGLPYVPVPGGSEGSMVAELKGAIAAEEPIIMMMWQPHWVFAEVDLNWVEWNPIEGNCDEKNQTYEDACGFEQADVVKVVWSGFEEKWPDAYEFVEKFTLTNEIQNRLILEVDQNGRSVDEVAREWIDHNESVWQPWVSSIDS
ncbi:ABC transporter substrate-binding protein (plasmid) [Pseudohalocynthiibacter aestuariivivens]|nr:ABC transporter substrate-binding protein [Pseudohalocynthiibacter aestuariivivens]QIE48197.1 ABC transporter substrate-binding protein [Pseudohalocynthiibacter aestuariivivens]